MVKEGRVDENGNLRDETFELIVDENDPICDQFHICCRGDFDAYMASLDHPLDESEKIGGKKMRFLMNGYGMDPVDVPVKSEEEAVDRFFILSDKYLDGRSSNELYSVILKDDGSMLNISHNGTVDPMENFCSKWISRESPFAQEIIKLGYKGSFKGEAITENRKSLKEDENVYDFTNLDENEDTFDTIIKEFNLMELSREEIESLGLGISVQNSVVGVYGSYVSGNGTPDVVVYDFEISDRQRPYKYTINVVQTQEHARAEKYFYIISSRLSQMLDSQSKGLRESELCPRDAYNKRQREINRENDATLAYGRIDDAMSAEFVKDSFFRKVPGSHHWSESVGDFTFVCSVDTDNYCNVHFSTYDDNRKRLDSKYVHLNGDCVEQFYNYIEDRLKYFEDD